MSGHLDTLQERLVDASRELSRARRRKVRRRGAVCAALIVLITPPALAASGVWRPALGDGEAPAPEISADAPPPEQLALFSVLRREQTENDRGVATRYALKFVDSPALKGVRTDSIRLLTQSDKDRGVVLVPVERYEPQNPPLPADTPPEVRKAIERPPIEDALCVYQLDSIDGAGVACHSSADIQAGRAWMMLGHRSLWIVPDGVATVRTEYTNHEPIEAPAHENAVIFTAPKGRITERRILFLDASGKELLRIDRPTGGPTELPAVTDPRAPESTRTGAVRRVAISGEGRHARYELLVRRPHDTAFSLVLNRPACFEERRVVQRYGGGSGRLWQIDVHPSLGDFNNARWCAGRYTGFVRIAGEREPAGTFSFRVR